ncbi:MAG: pirin family protein [Nonlabens sp.]
MELNFYPANQRGGADHGWLEARHSFSFASWFDDNRINFGLLRVLNDDIVAPGAGFPTHPHDNMEIITIPLAGVLEHKDSMGNVAQLKTGQIQVMSAGTGVTHSEYNASKVEELKLFQIWIFPNKKNLEPRYEEVNIENGLKDQWQLLVSPDNRENSAMINQNAFISIIDMSEGNTASYQLKGQDTGVYVMSIDGEFTISDQHLQPRDALSLEGTLLFGVFCEKGGRLLVIEVPLGT